MEDTKILRLREQDTNPIKAWLGELIGRTVYKLDLDQLELIELEVYTARVEFGGGYNNYNNVVQDLHVYIYDRVDHIEYLLNYSVFLSKEDAVNYISNKLLNK